MNKKRDWWRGCERKRKKQEMESQREIK